MIKIKQLKFPSITELVDEFTIPLCLRIISENLIPADKIRCCVFNHNITDTLHDLMNVVSKQCIKENSCMMFKAIFTIEYIKYLFDKNFDSFQQIEVYSTNQFLDFEQPIILTSLHHIAMYLTAQNQYLSLDQMKSNIRNNLIPKFVHEDLPISDISCSGCIHNELAIADAIERNFDNIHNRMFIRLITQNGDDQLYLNITDNLIPRRSISLKQVYSDSNSLKISIELDEHDNKTPEEILTEIQYKCSYFKKRMSIIESETIHKRSIKFYDI